MELVYLVVLIIIIIALIRVFGSKYERETKKVHKNNVYTYTIKPSVMSASEKDFFRTLERAVSERYYIFPQIHLSSLLEHKVEKQEWAYAFRHINGKSVDFVLCDKETLMPVYAIELDDYTHQRKDRVERDKEVERMFAVARFPLVRFSSKNVSEQQIIETLSIAHQKHIGA